MTITLTANVVDEFDADVEEAEIKIIREGKVNKTGVSDEEITTDVVTGETYVITAEKTIDGKLKEGEIIQTFTPDTEDYEIEIKLGSIAVVPEDEGKEGLNILVKEIIDGGAPANVFGETVVLWRKGITGIFRARVKTDTEGTAKFDGLSEGTYYAKVKYKKKGEDKECFGEKDKIQISGGVSQQPVITVSCSDVSEEAVLFSGNVTHETGESTAGMILKIRQTDDKRGIYRTSSPVLITTSTESFSLNLEKEEKDGQTQYKSYAVEVWNPDGTQETISIIHIIGFDAGQTQLFDETENSFTAEKDLKAVSIEIVIGEAVKEE